MTSVENVNMFPYEKKCFENTKTSVLTLEGLGGSKSDEVVIVIDPISDSQNVRYYCFLYEELIQAFRGAHRLYDWSYQYNERQSYPIFLLPIASGVHTHSVYNIYIDVETARLIVQDKNDTILLTEKSDKPIGSMFGIAQLHGSHADVFKGVAVNRRILEIENITSETEEEQNPTKIGDEHAVPQENEIFESQRYVNFNPPVNLSDEELNQYREEYKQRLDNVGYTRVNNREEWRNELGALHRDNDLPALILPDGTQMWYQNGQLDRDNDLPAIIEADGTKKWYRNGSINRDNDRHNVEQADGTQMWYNVNGFLHRNNDLPAVIKTDGTQKWYRNGEHHRSGDNPAVIEADGTREWWKFGRLHRGNDLPAIIEANGTRKWYQNGQLHRDNLPAIIHADGAQEWYQRDQRQWCDDDEPPP